MCLIGQKCTKRSVSTDFERHLETLRQLTHLKLHSWNSWPRTAKEHVSLCLALFLWKGKEK